ncbi:hypothetical protein HYT52_00205 [Candidatus Woesearchaeota archaeon]|nr:hypothetical protein [Candidatus Woesearchaeota archaeon]
MRNKLLSIMALFIVSLLALPLVSALSESAFSNWNVEVNGDEAQLGVVGVVDALGNEDVYVDTNTNGVFDAGIDTIVSTISIEEGQTVDVEVTLNTGAVVKDIEVEAKIKGYEYSRNEPMSDSTKLFDMAANTQKTVRMQIDLPRNLEKQVYWLHINVDSANSDSLERVVKLNVEPTRHGVDIADVTFSPGNTVKAGRSLLATVLLENFGDKEEEDVKVTVTMPALGVTASEYVDAVQTDDNNVDYEDVPEMFLAIPATAEAGDYDVVVKAEYDRFEEVVETYTVHVLANEMFTGDETTLVLAVGPENQNIQAGKAGRYAVALTNAGVKSRAYLLSAVAGEWATVSLSDSLVVLEPGKNKVVYVDVAAAQDATQGMQTVALTISANNEELETVSLGANVVAPTVAAPTAQTLNLRNGLEIALIVLVVILVIIGLIIGFSRLRKDEGDEEKAYY